MAVITLGGLAGGGARVLGPMVAHKAGADYVDRLILASVAREVGATVEALHQREQRPPTRGERFSRVLQRILARSAVTGAGGDPYFGPGIPTFLTEEYEDAAQPTITRGHELEDERYFEAVREVISDLAEQGNVVLVGRGAHVILRDVASVLRVGIVARFEDRVRVIMTRERLTEEQAQTTIEARDQARAHYFSRFFGLDVPDAPELYHLVVNTSDVDLDYAADLIIEADKALHDGSLRPRVSTIA
jgi:cytidylate kinase